MLISRAQPISIRVTLVPVAAAVTIVYFVLLGGTAIAEVNAGYRAVTASIGLAVVGWYIWHAPTRADRIDRTVLVAVLLFSIAAVVSRFPRQSFDSALGALALASGLFAVRDITRSQEGRRALRAALMTLSVVLTVITAARWLPLVVEWWSLTGWTVIPPLDLSLPAYPWGHRHDLALAVAMLYPAWLTGGRLKPLQAAIAGVTGILVALIVVVDGSRSVWLALGVASAVAAAPLGARLLHARKWARYGAVGLVGLVMTIMVVSGFLGSIGDRVFNLHTLGARSEMWGPLTQLWLTDPLTGLGPGSFPWLLQLTPYFDTNSWAPLHPDSVIFQLLPEAGLLGVAAALTVLVAILPPLLRSGHRAAVWALSSFAIAGLGGNPTDFVFLLAISIVWISLALPHAPPAVTREDMPAAKPSPSWMRPIYSVGWLGIAVVFLGTLVGGFVYDSAVSAIEDGRWEVAGRNLDLAIALDPGMALYWRQRAALELVTGMREDAASDALEATARNPSDDVGWRVLSLALNANERHNRSILASEKAVATQRTDPTNLLLLAWNESRYGSSERAQGLVAEAVQRWPTIVATPNWSELIDPPISPSDAIGLAVDRWHRHAAEKLNEGDSLLELVSLAGRVDLEDDAVEDSDLPPEVEAITLSVFACRPHADDTLAEASDSARRSLNYWNLVLQVTAPDTEEYRIAQRQRTIMSDSSIPSASATLNPLNENGRFSADGWGYRRRPISWSFDQVQLPSPSSGSANWILDFYGTQAEVGLNRDCVS